METKTPRTDMLSRITHYTAVVSGNVYEADIETVDSSFARSLEIENDDLRRLLDEAANEPPTLEQIKEYMDEIELLKFKIEKMKNCDNCSQRNHNLCKYDIETTMKCIATKEYWSEIK